MDSIYAGREILRVKILIIIFGLVVVSMGIDTLRPYDYMIIVFCIVGILCFLVLYGNKYVNGRDIIKRKIDIVLIVTLGMLSVFVLNRYADKSAPDEITALVIKKYITKSGHGNNNYKFLIKSPVSSPLPFTFDDTQSFRVNDIDYERIIPQHTKLTLKVHPGYLYIPWYEAEYNFTN